MIADAARRAMGARVLIAEDHVDSATGMGRLLRLYGYDVTIVTDGRDAVRAATRFAPQAALIGTKITSAYDTAGLDTGLVFFEKARYNPFI